MCTCKHTCRPTRTTRTLPNAFKLSKLLQRDSITYNKFSNVPVHTAGKHAN